MLLNMQGKTNKFLSMDCVQLGDWQIKASSMKGYILVIMHNPVTKAFVMHSVDDVKKANLIIEYVIEKGEL